MLPDEIEKMVVLTPKDIACLHHVSESTARRIFRSIKSVSDITHCNRIVHVQDYEFWLESRAGKGRTHCIKDVI